MITCVLSLGRASPFPGLTSTFLDSSYFHPPRSRREAKCYRKRRLSNRRIRTIYGAWLPVDPWAPVVDSQSVASQLFAFSLFPYIGFLYFITKSKSAPKLTLFGFYFLLAFVGATSGGVHRYLEKRCYGFFPSNFVGFSATTLTFLIVCSSPIYATVPAGIYAKVHYGTSLSNVDWLHGGAESLLTLTNLFIVLGLREGLRKPKNAAQNMPVSDPKEDK